MPDTRDDLRATSESIEADARHLARLEERKQTLAPEDPELLALSNEVEQLAIGLRHESAAEREISEEIAATACPAQPLGWTIARAFPDGSMNHAAHEWP